MLDSHRRAILPREAAVHYLRIFLPRDVGAEEKERTLYGWVNRKIPPELADVVSRHAWSLSWATSGAGSESWLSETELPETPAGSLQTSGMPGSSICSPFPSGLHISAATLPLPHHI
eukprot:jgi/Botrbrau1/17345/Bobra.0015s0090.1